MVWEHADLLGGRVGDLLMRWVWLVLCVGCGVPTAPDPVSFEPVGNMTQVVDRTQPVGRDPGPLVRRPAGR